MSHDHDALWSWRVARLREAFDASFARPLEEERRAGRRVLLFRVGAEPCAVPMEHCASVHAATTITRLPARHASFVGLATVDGAMLPVYDLAQRLGLPRGSRSGEWLVVSAGSPRVALLVDDIDGYTMIDAVEEVGDAGEALVTIDGVTRRLISLVSIVEEIGTDSGH